MSMVRALNLSWDTTAVVGYGTGVDDGVAALRRP